MSKVKDVVSSRTHKLAESWLSVRIETDVDNCKWVTIITDPVSWTASDHQDEMQGKLNAIAE